MKIKLKNGILDLTILRKGELLLAELLDGRASMRDLIEALQRAGIRTGYILDALQEISDGKQGQFPVAIARTEMQPAVLRTEYMDDRAIVEGQPYAVLARLHEMPITGTVMEGDRLVTLVSGARRVKIMPNGKEITVDTTGERELEFYAGPNVHANSSENALISKIDGLAQVSLTGRTSVYPFESYQSISKAHKRVIVEHSMLVQRDILEGAIIDIPGSLIVRGIVRPSDLTIGGDLDVANGLDNPKRGEEPAITVGGSVRASQVRRFGVWSGRRVLVHRLIDQSNVACMDTVATPRIADSHVSAGNRIITYSVVRDSVLTFGPGAVEDENIIRFRSKAAQHARKHKDQHTAMLQTRQTLEQLRDKALQSLKTLRADGQSQVTMMNVLKRYVMNMEEGLKTYNSQFGELEEIEQTVAQEQAELVFYENLSAQFQDPEILVLGRLEAGTRLVGPVDELTVDRTLQGIRVYLDAEEQKLHLEELPEEVTRPEEAEL